MSESEPKPYHIDYGPGVNEQIQEIVAAARPAGRLVQAKDLLKKARHQLRTDPNGWGDPEFRAKTVDVVMRHGIIRPISFRYAVYEQAHAVVLLSVRQYANFD